MTTMLDCRTVAIVKDLVVEQKTGANGIYEAKSILFRIAVDRDYKVTRQENGKTISEYPTDFWLAKATGAQAQAIADYCSAKKEDGKLVSRRLLLTGSFENYNSPRKVKAVLPVNIGGVMYNVEGEVEVPNNTATIFIIDKFKFLDSNPQNRQASGTATATAQATATPVSQGQPAGQYVPVGNAQPAQPVQTAPQTVQSVGGTVQSAGTVQGAMNPPVVGEEFVPEGQSAPF